jgi:predicted HTH domain antitoxin
MPKIELAVPVQTKYSVQELKEFFVAKLYEDGIVSSGTGAKMLDIERKDFILMLSKYNVCYMDYELSEYEKKLMNDGSKT